MKFHELPPLAYDHYASSHDDFTHQHYAIVSINLEKHDAPNQFHVYDRFNSDFPHMRSQYVSSTAKEHESDDASLLPLAHLFSYVHAHLYLEIDFSTPHGIPCQRYVNAYLERSYRTKAKLVLIQCFRDDLNYSSGVLNHDLDVLRFKGDCPWIFHILKMCWHLN